MRTRFLFSIAFVLVSTWALFAFPLDDKQGPVWLQQAAKRTAPSYAKDVPAVVLHSEQTVSVGADGALVITTDWAIRLLTREGRS